jgi:cell pole-organizing protein PopZ
MTHAVPMTEAPPPAATPDGADPSMEDILASIRRILNEDEAPPDTAAPDEASVDDDVLVLDQSMLVSAPESDEPEPEPEPPVAQAEPPVAHVEPPTPRPEPPTMAAPANPPETPAQLSDLMAPETAAAAASSVDSLVRTLAAGRNTRVYSGGPTLEDVVRTELRPLLKEWLDANLPPIVERLVRIEMERVVGRAAP